MKFKFLFGASLMLASGIAVIGCSSDNIPDAPDKVVEAGTEFYVKVAIADAGNSSTRAELGEDYDDDTSYNPGDAAVGEDAIKEVLFVFYDTKGAYVASQRVDKFEETTTGSNNVESIVDIIVPVTIQTQSNMPSLVVAYVNPTDQSDNNIKGDLSTIKGKTRTLSQILPKHEGDNPKQSGTNTNGFLMTNSVYYEKDAAQPVVATSVPSGVLYNSYQEAKDGTEGLNIYVERVVSKVTVNNNIPQDTDNPPTVVGTTGQEGVTIKFVPLAWGFNNEEKDTYILKNFRTGEANNTSSITNMSYTEANDYMQSLTDWNYPADPTNLNKGRRSFWAISPTYFYEKGIYPSFADEYKEDEKNNTAKFKLNQTKFKEIYDVENKKVGTKGFDLGKQGYTLEHTVSENTLGAADAGKRSVTSVIFAGRYDVYKADGSLWENYGNLYLQRGQTNNYIYVGDDFMMQKFLETQNNGGVIFTKNPEGSEKPYSPVSWSSENMNEIKAVFEIVHPEKDATGTYTASRYISFQIKKDATLSQTVEGKEVSKYYYIDSNGKYVGITTANRVAANSALYRFFQEKLGNVEEFNGGYAYFSIPVRHIWGRNKVGFGDLGIEETDATKGFTLGQYGIVRNHMYNINVNGISGIGTGLSDPKDPIVIPVENKEYHVKTNIRVQKWRIVPHQNVIVK